MCRLFISAIRLKNFNSDGISYLNLIPVVLSSPRALLFASPMSFNTSVCSLVFGFALIRSQELLLLPRFSCYCKCNSCIRIFRYTTSVDRVSFYVKYYSCNSGASRLPWLWHTWQYIKAYRKSTTWKWFQSSGEDWNHFHVLLQELLKRVPTVFSLKMVLHKLCDRLETFSVDCKWIVGEASALKAK